MTNRRLPAALYDSLKMATRLLREKAGGFAAAEAASRIGHSQLQRCEDRAEDKTFLTIDVVADIEQFGGEPVLTRALAAITGHTLVKLPSAKAMELDGKALGRIAKESADVIAAGGNCLTDGQICPDDAVKARREIAQLIEILLELDARFNEVVVSDECTPKKT